MLRPPRIQTSPYAKSGAVSQANNSTANSSAGNSNGTSQNAQQSLAGWFGGVQAIGQAAYNKQAANSAATSTQWCPANFALGALGGASQANNSTANSAAGNENGTSQNAQQSLAGYPWPVLVK